MSTDARHDCEWSLEQIHALLDGDLDPPRASALRLHLDRCETCRGRADEAARTLEALRQLPSLRSPDRVLASVRERVLLESSNVPPNTRPVAVGWPITTAGWGLLVVAASALLLFALRPRPVPPPEEHAPAAPPPIASTQEIKQAERQVLVAFELLRAAGERGASRASEHVIDRGLLGPASKLGLALRDPSPSGALDETWNP